MKKSSTNKDGNAKLPQQDPMVSVVKVIGQVLVVAFLAIVACVLILSAQKGDRDVDLGGDIRADGSGVHGRVNGSAKSPPRPISAQRAW